MGRLLVRGEYGHDIVDELRPRPGEVVIDKPGKGSFWKTDLHRRLMARGITHLLICGVTTECCVTTTAREANDRGFQCCILTDCTGGFDATFVRSSLDMISAYDGLFGFTASSADLLHAAQSTVPAAPSTTPSEWDGLDLSLSTLTTLYKRAAITPELVVESVYRRLEEYSTVDPAVWISLRSKDDLIKEAKALLHSMGQDTERLPVLYGVPFAVKDNFDVAGMVTTAAFPGTPTATSTSTAFVVQRLRDAGAILIGKTNMDQFATGLSGCRSPYGTPSSVFGDGEFISGGSSSGSGVAVGAGLVTFALGTDTAGSGRVPAALNGVVGYKPTKGTLSSMGMLPACQSLDTTSIFAKSTGDARRVWYVLDQHDDRDVFSKDPSSLPLELADYRPLHESRFTFATPPPVTLGKCCQSYLVAFEEACRLLEAMGGRRLVLPDEVYENTFQKATDLLYSGSLVSERIACIGYSFLTKHLHELHPTTRQLFTSVLGRATRAWEIYADQAAQKEATRQVADLCSKQPGKVDVLVTPTVPYHPTIAAMEMDPINLNADMGVFTHFGNVLDLCSISVGAGTVHDGMPFGIGLNCPTGLDGRLFDLAEAFETAINYDR